MPLWGQVPTASGSKKLLKQFTENVRQQSLFNHTQTVKLATQQRWPFKIPYSNGRTAVLQGVDENGFPIYFSTHSNAQAAFTVRATSLYLGGSLGVNLRGNSSSVVNRLGIWDNGKALANHRELNGRIKQEDNGSAISDHTTHLAGTLVATGINPIARGMVSGANLRVWDFTNDLLEMSLASPDLLVSNHSYGVLSGWVFNTNRPGTDNDLKWEWWGDNIVSSVEDYKFGFYDTRARDLDKIAVLSPNYLIVKSADNKRNDYGPPIGTAYYLRNTDQKSTIARLRNDSYGSIPTDGNAKNILTVGAVFATNKANPQPSDIRITSFSGWGPTDDGRIKPDLVSMGVDVTSTSSFADNAYTTFSGTSVAAPSVTGSLLLLQEFYARLNRGAFLRSATIKGLVLHTADEAGDTPGPDYRFGWGLLNVEKAAKVIANGDGSHFIQETSLSQGTTVSQQITALGNAPLVATLSWTDPEGTPNALTQAALNNKQPKLVNDLDLRLIDGMQVSLPWVLDPQRPAMPATVGDNFRDNVEQIIIPNPVIGKKYSLTVTHKGSIKGGFQPYSLIVSGAYQTNCQLTAGIAPSANTIICKGAVLRLSANTGTNFRYQWFKDGLEIAGATTYYLFVSQAGNYQVRILQGECTATSPSVLVSLSQVNATIASTGNTSLCNGGSVQLSAPSGTNYTYQWVRDSKDITGAISSSYTATQTGNYQVRVKEGACTVTSPAKLVQSTQLAATTIPSSDFTVCGANSVTFTANAGIGMTYQWFKDNQAITGATNAQLIAYQTGSYSVQVKQNGCTATSKAVKISFNSFAAFVVPSGTIRLCGGGSEVLYANTGSGYKYQWLRNGIVVPNVNTPYLQISRAGSYSVRITTSSCITTSSPVTVITTEGLTAGIAPLSSTVFYEGSSVTLQANTGTGLTHQWLRNGGELPGATANSYIARQSGNYTVRVSQDGCSVTSSGVGVIVLPSTQLTNRLAVADEQPHTNTLQLYPNPAGETIQVEFTSAASLPQPPMIEIFTTTGVMLQGQSLSINQSGIYREEIDIRLLPKGAYFLRVSDGKQSLTKGFLKQ